MSVIISNEEIAKDIYLMKVEGEYQGKMGQFYMLRSWDRYPVLSRPISIYNLEQGSIQFLYKVFGEGTRMFADLKPGDSIGLEGPFGNGFPEPKGRVAMVGGGIGIAPLYLAARQYPESDVFLGFSQESFLVDEFAQVARQVVTNTGRSIVDYIDVERYDTIYVCGPHGMMHAVADKAKHSAAKVYVSLEKRMACGVGACLVCSVICQNGNKRACADGPVFLAEEVNFDAENGL